MVELMLAALLYAQNPEKNPETGPICFISGEVYSSKVETKASLAPTNCPIDIQQDGRLITMTSPKWIVQVTIPEDIGTQRFLYQWGQAEAKIGDRDVLVMYKPVGTS